MSRRALGRLEAERDEFPTVPHEARAEVATIDRILDRREGMALAAARVSPADYLIAELGERPEEGAARVAWDRAAREVEGYRQRHGLLDRDTALGPGAEDHATRREQERVERSIGTARRELGIEQEPTVELGQAMEVER